METEIRFYYSINSKDKIINYLKEYSELKYLGRFYECTDQYNHPMKEYDFYSKDIDGRFRVRRTIGKDEKCMITWKRRLRKNELIHNEEEIEVSIKPNEYDNLCLLLRNVLHLELVESYERYRSVFKNKEVEIVVDEYPFGICIEIENKSNKDGEKIIKKWLNKLGFNIDEAYRLSWDDKYAELCKEQNKKVEHIVRFDKDMPKVLDIFTK
ncbi:MAG: CYTH domain-containing protein [Bacilli bacterium]|nr:CYTH domain-containing protein [Bacilli bacterium]